MLMHWPIADEAFGMTDRKRPRQLMLTNTGDYDEESFSHGIHEDEPLNERLEPSSKETSINPADVLCGRSKIAFNHAGNKQFRDAVSASLSAYMEAQGRHEKSMVVNSIVRDIKDSGGRFLKNNFTTGKWFILSDQQAKEKVGHAVRDAVSAFENKMSKKKRKRPIEETKSQKPLESGPESPQRFANLHHAFASVSSSLHRQVAFPAVAELPMMAAVQVPERVGFDDLRLVPGSFAAVDTGISIPVPSRPHPAMPMALASASTHEFNRSYSRPGPYHLRESGLSESSRPHREYDDHFMAAIDSVLGPLPPDAQDPMARYMHDREHER